MREVYCGFVASAVGVQRSGVQQSGNPSARGGLTCQVCSLTWRPRHQSNVELIKLLRVNIELHIGQTQIRRNLRLGVPKDRLAVAGTVVDVDVHVELFLPGDDGGVNQSGTGNLV